MPGDFLDSNIVLYSFDTADTRKQEIAARLLETGLREANVFISFQVVQEVLNGVTRGITPQMATAEVDLFVDTFLTPLWRVMPSRALYQQALYLNVRYRYGFYDSLIIAAALEAGCTRLLTEDMQDGQRIENLTIVNPFAAA